MERNSLYKHSRTDSNRPSAEIGPEENIQIYPALEKLYIALKPKDYKNESKWTYKRQIK